MVWSADSGVVAHLQSALDIASQGDCDGAKAAALGLTDFVSVAQRNAPASESGSAAAGGLGLPRLCRTCSMSTAAAG